jgi:hypothetical protein
MTRFRTSATVPGLAQPSFLITRCTEIARTDSDWTQLGVRSPQSVPTGIWKGRARWWLVMAATMSCSLRSSL